MGLLGDGLGFGLDLGVAWHWWSSFFFSQSFGAGGSRRLVDLRPRKRPAWVG